jgi:hypothetical protein
MLLPSGGKFRIGTHDMVLLSKTGASEADALAGF